MEEECKITLNTGLRGVTIANTRICEVDGKNGRLIYRGYKIQDLAKAGYEEVAHLLVERQRRHWQLSGSSFSRRPFE